MISDLLILVVMTTGILGCWKDVILTAKKKNKQEDKKTIHWLSRAILILTHPTMQLLALFSLSL